MDTLGEWSDGDDEWIWDVDDKWEFSDSEADDIIRNVWEFSDSEADDIIRNVQIGEGEKRKNNEEPEPEQDFYVKESVKKHMSKKFSMTATDHTIRFNNNTVNNFDLIADTRAGFLSCSTGNAIESRVSIKRYSNCRSHPRGSASR